MLMSKGTVAVHLPIHQLCSCEEAMPISLSRPQTLETFEKMRLTSLLNSWTL